jgi:hypothetical protein
MKHILLISIIFAVACTQQKSGLEEMRYEVMKIHDDSMEKIGEVRQAIFDLEERINNNPDSLTIRDLVLALENADEEMMLWMSEYKEPEGEPELKAFYAKEKERIQIVANKIYKSLEDAQKYIDK